MEVHVGCINPQLDIEPTNQCEVAIQQVDGWVDDGWEPAPGGPRPPESAPAVGGRLEHVVPAGHGVV